MRQDGTGRQPAAATPAADVTTCISRREARSPAALAYHVARWADRDRAVRAAVERVMTSEPTPRRAPSTGSWTTVQATRRRASIERLDGSSAPRPPGPRLLAHQIELYFSVVQRKALSPNSFDSLDELTDRSLRFGAARSPDRSTGPSPAPTWSACSPRSPSASRGLRLRRNGPRSPGRLAAQGCCQRALMIFHPWRVRTRWRYST